MTSILELRIDEPWLIATLCVASLGAVGLLLVRPRASRWLLRATVAMGTGAAIAVVFALFARKANLFGMPLPWQAIAWGTVGSAAVGLAIANVWGASWRRRLLALLSVPLFLLTTTLGINAYYGLGPTVGSFLHIQINRPISVPTGVDGTDGAIPLYRSWQPPADMPATGEQGTIEIPATRSGFAARTAGIYKPPAARTAHPPRLPLVIMMMGQPGDPDPQYIAKILDAQAQKNKGLAPYVLVVDQLGDPNRDPVCADSASYGNVETYVTRDVVDFARTLPVQQIPSQWTIVGYSNGGGCAFKYAAQHPDIWGNLLSVSGEIVPGSEHPESTIADVFGGSAAAFEAAKPTHILSARTVAYPDEWALFTAGQNDPAYIDQARHAAAAAATAGWNVDSYVVPGAGHVVDALEGGLAEGFARLYPRLGLSAP